MIIRGFPIGDSIEVNADDKKGFNNIIYGVLGQLIAIVFAIVTPKLVIENYGSAINDLVHLAAQIYTYVSLLEAGVGSATIQAFYKPIANGDQREISAIMAATGEFYKKTGILYSIGITAFALLYPVLVHTGLPYYFVFLVVFFGGIGGSIHYFYQGKYILLMQADGYTYINTKINVIVNILSNVVKVVLLLSGFNVIAVQLSYFVIQIAESLIHRTHIRKLYQNVDLSVEPDYAAISQKKAVFIHQLSYLVFSSTDVVLLTFVTQDLKLVSVYTLYKSIVTMLVQVVQHISTGFDIKLGQIYAAERNRYYRLYHVFEIFHMTIIFSFMTTLCIVLTPFLAFYTKNIKDINYINVYPLLFTMIPLLTHGRTATNSTITLAGHFEQTKWYSLLEAIINLSVSIVGITYLGIPGALLGTIVAAIYRAINMSCYCYKHLIPGSPWNLVKRWIISFFLFFTVIGINGKHPITAPNYIVIAVYAIGIAIIYLLCILHYNGSSTGKNIRNLLLLQIE